MPRIKPPRNQEQPALAPEPVPPPTEDVTFNLDDPSTNAPVEIDLAPQEPEEPKDSPAAPTAPAAAETDAVKRALEATQRAEDLQRQLAEMQRQNAQREQELQRERGDREDAQYNHILSTIAAEENALQKAEGDYANFASAGDWVQAAQAQKAMATATSRIDRLNDNKEAFEIRRKEAPATPAAPAQQSFEEKISGLPANARDWLRSHPEFVTDPSQNRRINAVHGYLTQTRGIKEFSKEFFDAIDAEFGFNRAAPEAEPAPAPSRRSMPVSAPVSRDVPTASGQRRTNSVTLSAEEREVARNSFGSVNGAPDLTPDQKERLYAQNKAKLARMRASGEYRQTTEQTG
jgi:hypothetical protein